MRGDSIGDDMGMACIKSNGLEVTVDVDEELSCIVCGSAYEWAVQASLRG